MTNPNPYLAAALREIQEQKAANDASAAKAAAEAETATVPYAKQKKADLEAEVARRNAARDEDSQITVEGKGTVADLVAALEADDEGPAASEPGDEPTTDVVDDPALVVDEPGDEPTTDHSDSDSDSEEN